MKHVRDWEATKQRYADWWAGTNTEPILQVMAPRADAPAGDYWEHMWGFLSEPDDPARNVERARQAHAATLFLGEAYPHLWLNMGPGVQAAFYTGYLKYDDVVKTSWFEQPHEWDQIEAMRMDREGKWYQHLLAITRAAVQGNGDDYIIGMTDIGGGLDVLASLRGTDMLLVDAMTQPDRIEATTRRIIEDWLAIYAEIDGMIRPPQHGTSAWMGIWCPGRWYPLQSDFSAMIGPDMFEQFERPSLVRLAEALDHTIYHWDGPGELPHLDHILSIEGVDGIQWVPGAGNPQNEAEQWYPYYDRIVDAGKRLVFQCWEDVSRAPALIKRYGRHALATVWLPTEADAREFMAACGRAA